MTISIAEFNANQEKYLDLAETETITIRRTNGRRLHITPAPVKTKSEEKDHAKGYLPTPEEQNMIDKAREEIRQGHSYKMLPGEDLDCFLDRIQPCLQ